jgi:hypothetical protein
MTKFTTIVAIHFEYRLSLATSKELLLPAIKFDATLVNIYEHLGGLPHHKSKRCIINVIIT